MSFDGREWLNPPIDIWEAVESDIEKIKQNKGISMMISEKDIDRYSPEVSEAVGRNLEELLADFDELEVTENQMDKLVGLYKEKTGKTAYFARINEGWCVVVDGRVNSKKNVDSLNGTLNRAMIWMHEQIDPDVDKITVKENFKTLYENFKEKKKFTDFYSGLAFLYIFVKLEVFLFQGDPMFRFGLTYKNQEVYKDCLSEADALEECCDFVLAGDFFEKATYGG